MSEFGNGVSVAVKALQDDLDLVDIFWRAIWKPRGRVE
jgi:hypothetical protein